MSNLAQKSLMAVTYTWDIDWDECTANVSGIGSEINAIGAIVLGNLVMPH